MEFNDFSRTSPKIQGVFKTMRTLYNAREISKRDLGLLPASWDSFLLRLLKYLLLSLITLRPLKWLFGREDSISEDLLVKIVVHS